MASTSEDSPVIEIPPFVIARDGCEKEPLDDYFPEGVALEIRDLRPTGGDYSVVGCESWISIERKSLADLLGTLWGKTQLADGTWQQNLGRFAWELQKMGRMHFSYVAIEGTRDDLKARIARRAKVCERFGKKQRIDYPRTMALISSLQVEFGVSFCFFRDRAEMAGCIYADLYHGYRRFHGLSKSKIGKYRPPRDGDSAVDSPPPL